MCIVQSLDIKEFQYSIFKYQPIKNQMIVTYARDLGLLHTNQIWLDVHEILTQCEYIFP